MPRFCRWSGQVVRLLLDMDCAAVAAAGGVDLLPTSGNLLFFFAGPDVNVPRWESGRRQALEQGRVIYLPAGTPRRPRSFPLLDPEPEYEFNRTIERELMSAHSISTPPNLNSDLLAHYFGPEAKKQFDRYWARQWPGGRQIPAAEEIPFPLRDDDLAAGRFDRVWFDQVH